MTSFGVSAQNNQAAPKGVDWEFALGEVDLNGDGLPSIWTFHPDVIPDVQTGVTAVAKTLSLQGEQPKVDVGFDLLDTRGDAEHVLHHRFQLTGPGGYPVLGAQLLIHETAGRALRGSGQLLQVAALPSAATAVVVTADKARGIAEQRFTAAHLRPAAQLEATELWYVPRDLDFERAEYVLAHRVDVYSTAPLDRHYAFVDAATGELVATQNRLHASDEPGTADTKYAGRQALTTDLLPDGRFRLYQETTRNTVIHTRNAQNGDGTNWVEFYDDDNDWTGTNANQDEVARDAHWGTERYHDLLTDYFGMRSIDGSGFNLIANVHVDFEYANAFWDGQTTNYGDGSPSSVIASPLTAIDVVGHELTHGLTEFSAGLIYNDESGALNEAFSDIYGMATRFYARPDQLGNWAVGDQMDPNGEGFRSLLDPNIHERPGTYRGDFWVDGAGVHTNSGVGGHWYYFLSEGGQGTNELGTSYNITGIGWEDALRVAHSTLTNYLTPASTYAEAAAFSVEAAGGLFGPCDPRTASVAEAWKAVGLPTPSLAQGIDFRTDRTRICTLGDPVTLTAFADTINITWDLGDGTLATGREVTHVYGPGTYTVTLYATACDGVVDTLVQTNLITVDADDPLCDTLILTPTGTRTERTCGGVLLDPGGRDNYPNNANSEVVILNPGDSDVGYRLTVESFQLEGGFDFLTLESIALGGARTQFGRYSSSELSRGQLIDVPGVGFAVTFTSDGSVRRSGFEINFESLGGSGVVAAGLEVDQPVVALFEPAVFTFTGVGQRVMYDFADGTTGTFASDVEVLHAYTQPGTYQVTQTVSGCTNSEVATTVITVGAGTRACAALDTAYVTLALGDSTTHRYTINNCGNNGLYLAALPVRGTVEERSDIEYTRSAATTVHQFDNLGQGGIVSVATITITYSGDYDGQNEFISVSLDGGLPYVFDDDGSDGNTVERTQIITLNPMEATQMLADGSLQVEVINSEEVDTGFGGRDAHTVDVFIEGSSSNSIDILGNVPAPVGTDLDVDLTITSLDRGPGVHRFGVSLQSNDDSRADGIISLPVALTVVGQALGELDPAVLDLGDIYALRTTSASTTLRSIGSDRLSISSATSSSSTLSQNLAAATDLDPGQEVQIDLEKLPTMAGTFTDQVAFESNAGTLVLTVQGNSVAVPLLEVDETPIVDTLLAGEVVQYNLLVRSVGLLDLNVLSNAGVGSWWTHTPFDQDIASGAEAQLGFAADATGLASGDYESAIILRTTDPDRGTVVIPVDIHVLGAPVAGIGNAPTSCGGQVMMINAATDDAEDFTWDFGDGNTSTDPSPTHTYTSSGTYTVVLVACNAAGCDTTAQEIVVDIDCAEVILGPGSPTSISTCVGQLFDSGGADATYSNGENYQVTLISGSDQVIELTPTFFETESGYDIMTLHDGPTTSDPVLEVWQGVRSGYDPVRSTGTSLTVAWRSDGSVVQEGFLIDWACVTSVATDELDPGIVAVFPNPVGDVLMVQIDRTGRYEVNLSDALGRILVQAIALDGSTEINTSQLVPGMYQLTIRDEQGAHTTKRITRQ